MAPTSTELRTGPRDLVVREIGTHEFGRLWPIFREVVAAGDSYSYPQDIGFEEAKGLWTGADARCFIATIDAACVGGYLLHANQLGLGNHVANAGYMVTPQMRGRGIASAMCEHSLQQAREAGFAAMQFNFVASSNAVAVRLWQRHGFAIVGTIPLAFRHSRLGLVDVFVMHRFL